MHSLLIKPSENDPLRKSPDMLQGPPEIRADSCPDFQNRHPFLHEKN
jgi:hypothetical protein